MKDIRIVIVSWNVEKLLERCLRSLPAACQNLEWDVVVVDNASHDESVARAREMGELHGLPFTVIANEKNVGFARACNQGIAGYEARYVVLLNPDTECPAGSLVELVRVADTQPKAGIVGPKLIYPDGRYQESVRRFPTVWSQLSILLRIHWFAAWLPTLRRYFHRDLDVSKEQRVDQVMGACFLIRRDLIEEIGGLDERYFIWFEEVDYCKMAVTKGWKVVYAPSATVIHHGGQSFGQLFSRAKQAMFNDSMLKYFQKWHPGWRTILLRTAMPISSGIARIMDALRTKKCGWIFWLIGIAAFEILSRATVFHPDARKLATLAVGIAIALIAARKPSWALSALLLELLVGSKGALLKIPDGMEVDGGTSLRVTMFAAFLAGWFLNALGYWFVARRKIITTLREAVKGRAAWFAVGALCIWATIQGQRLQNQAFFQDGNAWFFLILLIPIIDIARRDGKALLNGGTSVVIAALIWLPLKTLGLLYIFSHGIPWLSQPTYLWVRRTGVGEVTLVTGNLFRIFMQSQVYALIAWIVFAARAAVQPRKQMGKVYMMIGIGSMVSILVSLSRSFWIGLAAGGLALLVLMWREWKPTFLAWCGRLLIPVGIAFALLVVTVSFPFPHVEVGSLKTLFGSRGSTTDAAAESRWNLLPVLVSKIKERPILGSGFGATVTYPSKDPRILAQNPDGMYTTSAFEWGWLDHWIKFGVLGIPFMAWLLVSIAFRIWKLDEEKWLRAGFVASIVGMAALHVFTPYLNHPLGFGFLMGLEGWIEMKKQTGNGRRGAETEL